MTLNFAKYVEHSSSEFLPRIAKGISVGIDWLTGPAMSEQERLNYKLQESEPGRTFGTMAP